MSDILVNANILEKTVISKGKILVRLLGYMLVDRAMNFSVEKN